MERFIKSLLIADFQTEQPSDVLIHLGHNGAMNSPTTFQNNCWHSSVLGVSYIRWWWWQMWAVVVWLARQAK